jgi:hypothetical protein
LENKLVIYEGGGGGNAVGFRWFFTGARRLEMAGGGKVVDEKWKLKRGSWTLIIFRLGPQFLQPKNAAPPRILDFSPFVPQEI